MPWARSSSSCRARSSSCAICCCCARVCSCSRQGDATGRSVIARAAAALPAPEPLLAWPVACNVVTASYAWVCVAEEVAARALPRPTRLLDNLPSSRACRGTHCQLVQLVHKPLLVLCHGLKTLCNGLHLGLRRWQSVRKTRHSRTACRTAACRGSQRIPASYLESQDHVRAVKLLHRGYRVLQLHASHVFADLCTLARDQALITAADVVSYGAGTCKNACACTSRLHSNSMTDCCTILHDRLPRDQPHAIQYAPLTVF
mgnify:CR=1 FL=1